MLRGLLEDCLNSVSWTRQCPGKAQVLLWLRKLWLESVVPHVLQEGALAFEAAGPL